MTCGSSSRPPGSMPSRTFSRPSTLSPQTSSKKTPAAYDELLHWDVAGWVAELKEKMVVETDEVHAKPEQRKKQKKASK